MCVKWFMATPFSKPFVLTSFEFLLLQDHRRYEGARLTATTTTRLHIHLVQTLRKPHIALVRPRAELTETSIAVNHSMNDSVEH